MAADQVLQKKLKRVWQEQGLFAPGARILVAISGGADSVWMAYALHMAGYEIGLAHVNYGLRNEATAEEALVRAYAASWGLPVCVQHSNPKGHSSGDSLQMEARKQRYAFFEELMIREGYSCCATAHHADDQAETLLMSLLDGNSRQLWKGIPLKRAAYVRPLLSVRKYEIRAAMAAAGLAHGEDHTNALPVYRRNQLRIRVLPELEEMAPDLVSGWQAKWSREQRRSGLYDRLLAEQARPGLQSLYQAELFDWSHLADWTHPELEEILALVLTNWGLHGHQLWAGVKLLDSGSGHWQDTDQGRLTKGRQQLHLQKQALPAIEACEIVWDHPGQIELGPWQIHWDLQPAASVSYADPAIFWLAAEALQPPLVVRPWRRGDRMMPLGMKRSKKVSDILVDEKVAPWEKAAVLVLEDAGGIVGLSGFRIGERVRVGEETREVLQLSFGRI